MARRAPKDVTLPSKLRSSVLAFDLSATTGIAHYQDGVLSGYDVLKLTPKHDQLENDYQVLEGVIELFQPDAVVYETVEFSKFLESYAYHVSRATLLRLICDQLNIPCFGISVRSIKKRFTGNGMANKQDVIDKVLDVLGVDLENLDAGNGKKRKIDDIADAIACGYVAIQEEDE